MNEMAQNLAGQWCGQAQPHGPHTWAQTMYQSTLNHWRECAGHAAAMQYEVAGGRCHWYGILSGQITTACLENGMGEPDAAETAAVVMTVIEGHGWRVIPPEGA